LAFSCARGVDPGVDALDRTQARDLWEFIWPSGIGPRVDEPALLKIDPYPWWRCWRTSRSRRSDYAILSMKR
jgi:hypothetical protein